MNPPTSSSESPAVCARLADFPISAAMSLNVSFPRLTTWKSQSLTSAAFSAPSPYEFRTVVIASTATAVSESPAFAALAEAVKTLMAFSGAIAAERMSYRPFESVSVPSPNFIDMSATL